jgi:hypothetical protein
MQLCKFVWADFVHFLSQNNNNNIFSHVPLCMYWLSIISVFIIRATSCSFVKRIVVFIETAMTVACKYRHIYYAKLISLLQKHKAHFFTPETWSSFLYSSSIKLIPLVQEHKAHFFTPETWSSFLYSSSIKLIPLVQEHKAHFFTPET